MKTKYPVNRIFCGPAKTKSTKISYPISKDARPVGVSYVNEGHKEFVKFCNALRCPLCGAQLDGLIHAKRAQLYCVTDNNEYKVVWYPGEVQPKHEMITYTYPQYQYVIEYGHSYYSPTATVIKRYNMDVKPEYRDSTMKELFVCNERMMFFRKRLEEDVFLNKLKTYQVFS